MRRTIHLLFVIGFLCPAFLATDFNAGAAAQPSFAAIKNDVRKLIQQKQFSEAAAALVQFVEAGHHDAIMLFHITCQTLKNSGECAAHNTLRLLDRIAAEGDASARYLLNIHRFKHAPDNAAQQQALNAMERLHAAGHGSAGTFLGDQSAALDTADGYSAAIKYYTAASQNGDPQAAYRLGLYTQLGRGLPKSDQRAAAYYRQAAEAGNPHGMNALGVAYQTGRGVETDRFKAIEWFRAAAKLGHTKAQYNLATILLDGEDPEVHYFEATHWLEKAAIAGNIDAQDLLGNAYYRGEGVQRDGGLAEKWLSTAAERGHVDAQYSLGRLYSNRLLRIDTVSGKYPGTLNKLALKWYRTAIENGSVEAMMELGKHYYYGSGSYGKSGGGLLVEKDPAQAEKLFQRAERLGGDRAAEAAQWRGAAISRRRIMREKLTPTEAAILMIVGVGILGAISGNGGGASSVGTITDNCPGFSGGGFGMACGRGLDVQITAAQAGLW